MPSNTLAHLPTLPELRLMPRQCRLQEYTPQAVPGFAIADQFIAYASPEATFAVTRHLLAAARRTILIGIYDFTASYVRDLLVAAVQRGVQVSVMLDLDQRKGEPELWADLLAQGCVGVPAPSCASAEARYFPSCHEKVIVVDDNWTLVQSGNYSEASIPQNTTDGGDPARFVPGNRDMGLAVHSAPLAAFFTQVLEGDMQLELAAPPVAAWRSRRLNPGSPWPRPGPRKSRPRAFQAAASARAARSRCSQCSRPTTTCR